MVECGKVIKIEKKNNVRISFDRKSACDQCRMCAVSKSGKTVEIVVPNNLGAQVGDSVLVSMGDKFVLTAALIVYIIPLILVVIGVAVGASFGVGIQLLLVFVALVIGFVAAALLDKKVIRKKKGFVPEMTKILATEQSEQQTSEQLNSEDETTR